MPIALPVALQPSSSANVGHDIECITTFVTTPAVVDDLYTAFKDVSFVELGGYGVNVAMP